MERLQVWGLFGLVVLAAAQSATHSPQASYLLLVPTDLRPGVPPSVSVSILSRSQVLVSAHILDDEQVVSSNSTAVEAGSTELLTLPPISDGSDARSYLLEVKGHVGSVVAFSDSTRLDFNPKGHSTFIQTDKGRYGRGQAVRIRVVSVRPDWTPFSGSADILIRDPKGNLLRQWTSLDAVLGVVSKEFQLSENPPLGVWSVTATVGSVSSEKFFEVANYVLPKFEVLVEAPDVVLHGDTLWGSITAKYVFGKPVQGDVNVTIHHVVHGVTDVYEESKEISGSTDFVFEVPESNFYTMRQRAEDMLIDDGHMDHCVLIIANVTERLTGLTYSSAAKVPVAKSRYVVSFDGYPPTFRPSLDFAAMLKVSRYNQEPLSAQDQQKVVIVTVMQGKRRQWWSHEEELVFLNASGHLVSETPDITENTLQEMQFPVPADGCIALNLHIMNDTQTLTVNAYFEDGHDALQLYSSYSSPSRSYLQIKQPSTPAQVGSSLQLEVDSNFPVTEFHYLVKSRGQLVSAGTSSAPLLALVPHTSWAPLACVVVFCVHPDGEVVNDAVQLPVSRTLLNQVSLSWSDATRRPGQEVTLKVTAKEPASLVGILVVDKATKLKGSTNDITKEAVLQEMKTFGVSVADASDLMAMGDPHSVFQACDLLPLTDARLHRVDLLRPELPGEGIFHLTHADGPKPEQEEELRARSRFPETWIWRDVTTGDSDSVEVKLEAPDSITSWVATAFVMSDMLGLGVVEQPAELTVFQEFFLSLNLPLSVIRGEELLLEVVLFNYLQDDLQVTVIVAHSDAFDFISADNEELAVPSVHTVFVGRQGGASVLVPIRPLVLGDVAISVKATSSAASDLVIRNVFVKAEGLERSFSSSLLFELSPSQLSLSRQVTFSFPPDVVSGSERAAVTVVGDILGPSISGLDSLIQMPSGCGEQNMIHFAPNIYVLQYLSAVGGADQQTTARALDYMQNGYERELTYQRGDGSFSAFGEQDSDGSTWLTAFVLKCFLQARSFILIDALVLHRAAAWLAARQRADGSFNEPGRVIHTELQGGQEGDVTLTTYVLIALMEDDVIKAQYDSQVSAGLTFLETRRTLGVSSNYSLSLLAYALALGGASSASTALSDLIGRAEMTDGVPMWPSPDSGGLSLSWQPRSADIEMASYVLLAQHKLGQLSESLVLMRWLSQQRNHLGGFSSTQDTVVALQALSVFAALSSPDVDLKVRVSAGASADVAVFHINQGNYLVHQSQQIGAENLNLLVAAEGQGLALFQLNVFYNVRNEGTMMRRRKRRRHAEEHEAFHLYVELFDEEMNSAHLYICVSLSQALGLSSTGMVLLQVDLLSGFSLPPDAVLTSEVIKKVETQPGKVVLYLDSVTLQQLCVLVPLLVEHKVAKVQDANVHVYDYYEPRRRTVRSYTSEWRAAMSACSFCGGDCSQCRSDDHQPTSVLSQGGRSPPRPLLFIATFIISLVFSM